MRPIHEWPRLLLATWNIGPGKVRDLLQLLAFTHAVALQEASDQAALLAAAINAGWKVVTGNKPGQPATPLAYDPRVLKLVRAKRYLLARSQDVGPGAGPDTMKAKWAIGGLFLHRPTGRLIWLFSVHYVATQGKPRRRAVALAMTNRLRLLGLRLRRPVFVLADANTLPDSRVMRALRRAGWVVNHLVDRWLRSHGRRAIDQIWWTTRRWIRLIKTWLVANGSDHDAVVAEFAIKPKHRRKKEHR